jgi:hypothetical protein
MELWMDVDAALSEVPVNIAALIDDADFKTQKTAVAYNASGMALKWNFVDTAGNFTQTAVTPTTSGTYDWAHQGGAMYSIEMPASGGASINNDTEGFGWFTGVATGVLPWRGPVIGFRAAGLNDKLIDSAYDTTRGLAGTALPAAAAEASGGLGTLSAAQASNGTLQVNVHRWLTGTPNALQSGRVDSYLGAVAAGVIAAASFAANALDAVWSTAARVLTAATNITSTGGTTVPQTGDSFARLGAPAGASVSADVAAVKTDTGNLVTRITSTLFSGITSLAQWLGLLAGKQTGNSTARTEVRATGAGSGTFDETTDSQEALRDRGDAAWTSGGTPPTAAAIADAVWEETLTDHSGTAGSTAEALGAAGSAGDPWTTALPGAYGSGTAGKMLSDVKTDTGNLVTRITSTLFSGITSLAQWLGLLAGKQTGNSTARTEVRATGAGSGTFDETTDSLEAGRDNMGTAGAALLDLADGVETSLTLRQAMRLIAAASAGKLSGAATTTVTIRNAGADTKNRIVATVDADGNRSAVTLDLT